MALELPTNGHAPTAARWPINGHTHKTNQWSTNCKSMATRGLPLHGESLALEMPNAWPLTRNAAAPAGNHYRTTDWQTVGH
eukprot:2114392-Lingulodinium_polyedra.AAC.1